MGQLIAGYQFLVRFDISVKKKRIKEGFYRPEISNFY